jgi:hypothetical protein
MNPWQVRGDLRSRLGHVFERVNVRDVRSYRSRFQQSCDSAEDIPDGASLIITPVTRCLAVSS